MPDAFGTVPKEWTSDQVRQFQDDFDARMSGNLHRRRMLKFMPADFRLIEYRQPPLKDQYDEWLARVICYAFSVPATPFVSQVEAVEQIFAENGVPWSEKPLLPIMPSGTSAAKSAADALSAAVAGALPLRTSPRRINLCRESG